MRKGIARNDLLIAIGLILLLGGLSIFAAVDAGRRSRDAGRLSQVRQLQASLEGYRSEHASYPSTLADLRGAERFDLPLKYVSQPDGCASDSASLCGSYLLTFSLEGTIGTLPGGRCQAGPEGLTCKR